MPNDVQEIIQHFAEDVRKILGGLLDDVILYGSYARGDYLELSDIDIIILTSLTAEQIKEEEDKISDLAFDYMVEYTVDISPVVVNTEHFNEWMENLPYYRNIKGEGIRILV